MKPKSTLRSFLAITGGTLLAISYTHAATLYWDGTDTDANANGGAGIWDNLSTSNWDTAAIAGTASQWDNSNSDTAVFGGGAGTLTLGANITFGGLRFDTTGYIIASSTFTPSFGATATDTIILFNNIAAAAINNGAGGSGNVILKATNPTTAGTLTLGGSTTGGWTGTTTINAGMTVLLNTTNKALFSTSGITLNGGGISTASTNSTQGAVDRIANGAGITSNGGTFTYTNTSGNSVPYTETIGAVDLASAQLNLVLTNNQSGTGTSAQTLTIGTSGSSNLTRSSTTSAVTFASGGGLNTTKNMIMVTGAGTTSGWISGDSSNSIIAPWATTGTTAAGQTDYAVYSGDYVVPANTLASDQSTWSDAAKSYTLANAAGSVANGKLAATRNLAALRNTTTAATVVSANINTTTEYFTLAGNGFVDGDAVSATGTGGLTTGSPLGVYYVKNAGVGGTDTFQLSLTPGGAAIDLTNTTAGLIAGGISLGGNDLGTSGILNGSTAGLPIVSSGGSITLPASGAGNLHVTTGSGIITIAAPIKDFDGSSPLTLVKGGTAGTLSQQFANYTGVLVLTGSNTFTGGTVLNAGSVYITSENALGATLADRKVTANGIATLAAPNSSTYNLGALTVNVGAVFTAENSTSRVFNFTSASGTGVIIHNGNGSGTLSLGNASAFTGNLQSLGGSSSLGNVTFNSLSDASGGGNLQGGGTNTGGKITYSGSVTLTLSNRQVEFLDNGAAGANLTLINNSSTANTWVINTNLVAGSAALARTLGFDGTNTGANAFAGTITNTTGGGVISLTKSGAGTWALSGANTYTGATTLTAGTLSVGAANNLGASAANLVFNGGTLRITGTALTSFSGIGHTVSFTAAKLVGLDIADAANTFTADQVLNQTTGGLTKVGVGTLVLNQANTYTGTTTAGGGVLKLDNATALPGGIAATGGTSNLTINGGGIVGLTADFNRAKGTTAAQCQWTGSGGFAAYGGDRTVDVGAAQWNTGSFVPGAQSLILSAANSDATLIWANTISFAGSTRTIQVNNGSAAIDARISGKVTGGAGGLAKTGTGTLELTNSTNDYTGTTSVSAGTLRLGASNVLADASNVSIGAATLDSATYTDTVGTLDVTGAATINLGAGVALAFADSSGVNSGTWAGTLNINGTLGATSLRFGTTSGGLTSGQLAVISVNGSGLGTYILDADGYFVAGGGGGNTAPTISDVANQSVPSGGTVGPVNFTVNDAETAVGSLSLSVSANSNPGLVSSIVFGGSGGSRTVTATPVSGLSGTATITIRVTDGGALFAEDSFTLTVTDNYLSWAASQVPPVTGGSNGDSDNDGVKNLVEYALVNGGERGVLSGNTITYTKRGGVYGTDVTYDIESSIDLSTWGLLAKPPVVETTGSISYTFTPGTPVKNFARLKVVITP